MSMRVGDIGRTPATPDWSLGAVLAEREIDERTWLALIRPDAGVGASLEFARRLLGLRLAGYTTIVVSLGDADRVADVMLAALMGCRRKLARRDGRLVVAAERPAVRRALARAGLEVAVSLGDR